MDDFTDKREKHNKARLSRPNLSLTAQRLGRGTTRGPIEQLHAVDDRQLGAAADLHDAADISGGDHVGHRLENIRDFARLEFARDLRLEEIISPGRAAADMPLRHGDDVETGIAQQNHRGQRHLLPML